MTPRPVRREAFRVRLRPGALEEWVRRHEQVWPDLLAVQGACGFRSMSVYADDPWLVVVSEVEDADSWERPAVESHQRSEIHEREGEAEEEAGQCDHQGADLL